MIVGAGGIAPAHIEGYLAFPERVKITAVANPTLSRAEGLIEKYNLDAVGVTGFEEHLEEVDILSICSPPKTHLEIAVRALKAGKHVLLEKPMATSLEECDAIIAAADQGGGKLSVVAQSRFISSIANTLKIIHSGNYGRLLFSQINSFWYRGQSYYDLYWRGGWDIEGGGCTLNHGVHHIDLLLWAKGMPEEVISVVSNLNHNNSEEEDISLSTLKYSDGTMAQINCSLIHHSEDQKLSFQMEDAGISIPFGVYSSSSRSNGFPLDDEETMKRMKEEYNALPLLKHEHHTGQVENFLDCIEKNVPLVIDGREGRKTIELITGIYKSAFTGSMVAFPISDTDDHYRFEGRVENAVRFNRKTREVRAFEDTSITSFKGKF
jgi:predicted dehydrogenase